MDQDALVIGRLNAGSLLLKQLVQDQFEVAAAFWTQIEDDDYKLHIVNKDVVTDGLLKTYGRLHESLGRLPEFEFSFLELDLLGSNEPAALQVADLLARQPSRAGVSLPSGVLGQKLVQWGYVYPEHFYHPSVFPEIPEKLFSQLFGLIGRGPGPLPTSRVALRSGNSFDGVPVAFSMGVDQVSKVQFRIDGEASPREVVAEDILAIL